MFTIKPLDGGKALVTLEKSAGAGKKRVLEVEVTRAEVEKEAAKMGFVTPATPATHKPSVPTDRVTG